jgi:hypothetical protein
MRQTAAAAATDSDSELVPAVGVDAEEEKKQKPLIKPRTIREFRMWAVDWMSAIESSMEEGTNPAEESPRYRLLAALLNWLDGKGGRGADKKLRRAFIEACPEVGDE